LGLDDLAPAWAVGVDEDLAMNFPPALVDRASPVADSP